MDHTDQIRGSMSHQQKDLRVKSVVRKNERGGEHELREREVESKSEREKALPIQGTHQQVQTNSFKAAFSKMNEGMKQATESGDINALHQLIGEDVNLLDHIDQIQCVQTPLHIAASAGHIQFATEMIRLKPSLAQKLNPDGFSPIHLALKNGHIELVRQLLEIDRDLAHVKGKECITPLHYVVETGDCHIDLLDKFLLVSPNSIADVTVRDETALHIALKKEQLEVFKFLVGWLGRNLFKNTSLNVFSVLNRKDDEGNTVLHIVVSKNETQVVRHLLTWGSRFVDVNSTNSEGKTAWDISQGQTQVNNREIKLMLHSAGTSSGLSFSTATRNDDNNIDEFYNLIGEDVKLLEYINELPFVNTPFHIAASYGNIKFALELMNLKPSFARKLDPNGFSPIHLALQNGHIELVLQLLQYDRDLIRVKGRECLTPLHYVVESGEHLDLLEEFLSFCPNSIIDVTGRNETVLHIALKYNRLKAFKFFVKWLGLNVYKNDELHQRFVLNKKDNEGNTVLHIAVSKNQTEAVNHLLTWGFGFIRVNHRNSEGKTAWDIFEGQTQEDNNEIRILLRNAGASSGSSLSAVTRSGYNDIDVELLEHINELPFVNTPLHIAASVGNIQFAMEMIGLKPSFARKLNQNGFSPIHIALQNGHIKLVRRLLQFDGDLVRVKGREQLTPLHYVVESGEHLYLLEEFLLVCPDSITDVTVQNETALHIALKNDKLEAFKFFVGWLANNSSKNAEFNQRKVLNWKDNEGNTVLHILVSKNQIEAVRHFLSWGKSFVDVNSKNLEDKTAWDLLQEGNREIRNMPRPAGAEPGSSNGYPNLKYQMPLEVPRVAAILPHMNLRIKVKIRRDLRKFTVEWRNMLLVVAALLITLSFQGVLTPPGGVWQDNGLCITTEPPFNKTVGTANTTLACEHKTGTAIALKDGHFFTLFLACNTLVFSFSNSLVLLLIPNSFVKSLFYVLNIILCFSYFYSVWTIAQEPILMILLVSEAVFYFFYVQLLSK